MSHSLARPAHSAFRKHLRVAGYYCLKGESGEASLLEHIECDCYDGPVYYSFNGGNDAAPLDHVPRAASWCSLSILLCEHSLISVYSFDALSLDI